MLSLSFHALLPVAPIILRDILVVSYGNSSKTARCELALPITFDVFRGKSYVYWRARMSHVTEFLTDDLYSVPMDDSISSMN